MKPETHHNVKVVISTIFFFILFCVLILLVQRANAIDRERYECYKEIAIKVCEEHDLYAYSFVSPNWIIATSYINCISSNDTRDTATQSNLKSYRWLQEDIDKCEGEKK